MFHKVTSGEISTVGEDTFYVNWRLKNTNTIKMQENTDLFWWQVPELKKYFQ